MTNTNKGGYQILDLGNVDLTGSPTIEGLYELIEGTKKPIRLTRINLGGVEKHDVVSMPVVSGSDYVFENIYGYDVSIDSDGNISLASTKWATRTYADNVAALENIKDEDGHIRFTDYSISFEDTHGTDVHHGLACLNGKSLDVVGVINRKNLSSTLGAGGTIGTITIPEWLGEKIYTWLGESAAGLARLCNVELQDANLTGVKIGLYKTSNTLLTIGVITDSANITQSNTYPVLCYEINLIID